MLCMNIQNIDHHLLKHTVMNLESIYVIYTINIYIFCIIRKVYT